MDGFGIFDDFSGGRGVVESDSGAITNNDSGVGDVESVDGAYEAQDIAGLEGGFQFGNSVLGNKPDVSVAQVRLALQQERVQGIGIGELCIS